MFFVKCSARQFLLNVNLNFKIQSLNLVIQFVLGHISISYKFDLMSNSVNGAREIEIRKLRGNRFFVNDKTKISLSIISYL